MSKFYITTPIYYVNDKPHIGHAYTTLAADVLVRFLRMQGNDVFFVTGTDEHGTKIARLAEKIGISPKELCDKNSEFFKKAWQNLNIKYDYFIRTTDERHRKAVIKFIKNLKKKNVIYAKEYEGLYCIGCEKFLSEKELENGLCPDHKTKPEEVSEKNYFFKLNLKVVKELIDTKQLEIRPQNAKSEVLGLLKQELDDFSISRKKERVKWGINLPFDKNQLVYVWVDALLNYISAIGYGDNPAQFKEWWKNAHVIHLLGRDILKFHAIYWPAMLDSVGEKVPDEEFIHGFFTVNGQKMSKTLGNIIDPNDLVKKFGTDGTRHLLLSQFPFGQDGDIKESQFIERYNTDLANGLGNLVSRVLALSEKVDSNVILNAGERSRFRGELTQKIKLTQKKYKKALEEIKLYEALKIIWQLISFCDEYIEKKKPWDLAKNDQIKFKQVLSGLLVALKEIAILLQPFLPATSEKILNQVKQNKRTEVLFPRL